MYFDIDLGINQLLCCHSASCNLPKISSQVVQVQGAGFAEYNSTPIILGLTLVKFEPITTSYKLKAKFPHWHKDLSISIWKYRGNTSAHADDISLRLARIEQKIDYTAR